MSILAVFTYLVWRAASGKKKDSTALQQRLRQNDIAEAERKTLLETEQNGAAGTPHKHKKKETGFTGQIGFVMAAAGSAVGVGNLWRFPYLAAKDGGGLFIIIYLNYDIPITLPEESRPLFALKLIKYRLRGFSISEIIEICRLFPSVNTCIIAPCRLNRR